MVETGLECRGLVLLLPPAGEGNGQDLTTPRFPPQLAHGLITIHARHPNVEDDCPGAVKPRELQRLRPVEGRQYAPMIKELLASRFGLVAHSETHDLTAYVLRVDAGGSKLDPVNPTQGPFRSRMRPNLLMGVASDLKPLTNFLMATLGHPVVDETGLKGHYDFAMTGPLDAGSLPKALQQQLGLTIELTTAPIEVVVVDSVRQPSLDSPPAHTP